MLMKRLMQDPLFAGVISLQVAALGIIGGNERADSVTAQQIVAVARQESLAPGSRMPSFTAYDAAGQRQSLLWRGRAATVIFKSTCGCETFTVENWEQIARRRGEDVTTVTLVAPHRLGAQKQENRLVDRALSIRPGEMQRLGLGRGQQATAVHLNAQGRILTVEQQ